MPGPCSPDFERLAAEMGDFGCDTANAVLNLHNPFGLDHFTMPVLEWAIFAGAVLSLIHAVRRRRQGDPTVLALWIAAIAYLVIVEPPLYFPDKFGLMEQTGLIFVHNQFTVQFLWDRLPLYIISIYPVMAVLAYELVRIVGVFERRGPFVSALTVGFVYHVFYEIFDHVGPQLRWWIWNPEAPSNPPFFASVPMSSMVTFAIAGPVVLTWLIRVLVARRAERGELSTGTLVGRSVLAGFLMPIGLVLGGLPGTVFTFAEEVNRTGQAIALWIQLGVTAAVAIWALLDASRQPDVGDDDPATHRYLRAHAGIYLGAILLSWVAALPDYFRAVDGVTPDGTPVGSLAYAVVCTVFAVGFLSLALRRGPESSPSDAEAVAAAA